MQNGLDGFGLQENRTASNLYQSLLIQTIFWSIALKWSASRIILFLEFPWVLTHFDITITLSSEELASFAKMRLSFANKTDTAERGLQVKQSHNSVNAVDLFIKLSKMSETTHV